MTIGLFSALAIVLFIVLLSYAQGRATETVDERLDYEAFRDTVVRVTPPPPVIITPPDQPVTTEPTMAQFQTAYDIVRRHEGGFQIMPEDSGNYNSRKELVGTNWGINAQVYENHLGRPPTESDMREMPRYVALSIYKKLYWDRIKGDQIRNQQVANIFFDGHVNHGRWGIQMMQQALGVTRDGVVGPQTLGAINAANPFQLFTRYKQIRREGYQDLVRRRPKDQRFLRGWLIRIDSFNYQGVAPTNSANPQQVPNRPPAAGEGGGGGIMAALAVAATAYFLS